MKSISIQPGFKPGFFDAIFLVYHYKKYNNIVITERSKGLKIDHFLQKSTTFCKVVETD